MKIRFHLLHMIKRWVDNSMKFWLSNGKIFWNPVNFANCTKTVWKFWSKYWIVHPYDFLHFFCVWVWIVFFSALIHIKICTLFVTFNIKVYLYNISLFLRSSSNFNHSIHTPLLIKGIIFLYCLSHLVLMTFWVKLERASLKHKKVLCEMYFNLHT